MRQILAATEQPFPEKLHAAKGVTEDFNQLKNVDRREKSSYLLTYLLFPAIEAVFQSHASAVAIRNETIVVIAVERHRRHGKGVPEKLIELVPDYLLAVLTPAQQRRLDELL